MTAHKEKMSCPEKASIEMPKACHPGKSSEEVNEAEIFQCW